MIIVGGGEKKSWKKLFLTKLFFTSKASSREVNFKNLLFFSLSKSTVEHCIQEEKRALSEGINI